MLNLTPARETEEPFGVTVGKLMVFTFEPVMVTLAGTPLVTPVSVNFVFVFKRTVTDFALGEIETGVDLALGPSKIGCVAIGVFGAGFTISTGGGTVKPPPDPAPPPPPPPPPELGGLTLGAPSVVIEVDGLLALLSPTGLIALTVNV